MGALRIKTSKTNKQWHEALAADSGDQVDLARDEAGRFLAQAVRSPNLVVLAGLGTSLCVVDGGKTLAPTMGDLADSVIDRFSELDGESPLATGKRWDRFRALANVSETLPNLEHLLSRAKVASDFLSGASAAEAVALLEIAEEVIRKRVTFLRDGMDLLTHQAFLRRVARRSTRLARIKLFTSNYDLCFEAAARQSGFVVVDGFAFGSDAIFQSEQFDLDVVRRSDGDERSDYIESLFHLYKMHGSIDWELNEEAGSIRKVPGTKKPLLIYPRTTKYELAFSHPYIEMMGGFQAALRQPNTTLLVLGFGFNDKHIAEPILAAVRSNLSLNVIVVDPTIASRTTGAETNAYLTAMDRLIDGGDGRISLIEETFEDIIALIPDVVAETELERHLGRVKSIGASRVAPTG